MKKVNQVNNNPGSGAPNVSVHTECPWRIFEFVYIYDSHG